MKNSKSFALSAILLAALFVSLPASAEIKNTSAQTAKIDQMVNTLLGEKKIKPNTAIDDERFVRRIYLAAVGRIPTGAEARAFLESRDKNKRDELIDTLLESEGYVSHFYNYWADVLRINRRLGRSGASNEYAYKHWVKESLRSNRPYDKMVYELVAAEGNVWDNGATGYYQRDRGMPLDNMANTVRIFLGTRLECAQCHDHPFDKWTQQDFFHMASFTYGVKAGYTEGGNRDLVRKSISQDSRDKIRKITENVSGVRNFRVYRRDSDIKKLYAKDDRRSVSRRSGIETVEEYRAINKKVTAALSGISRKNQVISKLVSNIYNPIQYASMGVRDKNAELPHDYQYDDAKPKQKMEPSSIFGAEIEKEALENGYLPTYAKWMTDRDNPRFTAVIANRLWKKAFGIGLVEPVDQYTDYTKAHNPALMEYLEQCMKDLDYDMKAFLAMLYKSEAWQRGAHSEEISPGTPFYFPGPAMQRMSAEQIWDSLATLTIPDVDHYQPKLGSELMSIDRDRKIYNALEGRSPAEFKKMVAELSVDVKASYARQAVVREKYLKARQDEDEQLIRKYSREIRDISSTMRKTIARVAYNGVDRKGRSKDALMAGAGMAEMSGDMQGGERYVRTSLPRVILEVPKDMSKGDRGRWSRKQKAYYSAWKRGAAGVMRASELPTPAPRGHFLREFGQSDRELIQNASESASVPQALSLMNSKMADTLNNPYSVLGQALAKCETPGEEIQTLYQLMLTRQPTEGESKRLLREYKSNPDKAQYNIIWALLNTQQFIFNL